MQFVKDNKDKPRAEFYIPTVVNQLLEEDAIKLTVLRSDDQWYGVTYQEDKSMVQEAFQELTKEGVYPSPLW